MKLSDLIVDPALVPDKQKYFVVSACAKGIKKRCRKPSFESVEIAAVTLEIKEHPNAQDELKALGREKLAEVFKEVHSVRYLHFMVQENDGIFKSAHIMGPENIRLTME